MLAVFANFPIPVNGNTGNALGCNDDADDDEDDEDDEDDDAALPSLLVSDTIGRECDDDADADAAFGRCGDCRVESSKPRLDSGSGAYFCAW